MTSATLETIPLLAELPADRLDELAAVCTEIEVEAGATLIQEGDFGYAMFAIVAGTADVVKDGERVRRMQPGDVFGEIAILSGGRRTATVVARTAMTLITVMNRGRLAVAARCPECRRVATRDDRLLHA